jgi:hypothetical protein
MTNLIKGEVSFQAEGKMWTLIYSVNALCAMEAELKTGALAVAESLGDTKTMRIDTMRTMFWAGLRDHHPETTLEDAGRIMTAIGFHVAIGKASEAFSAAFPNDGGARPLEVRTGRAGKRS